MRKTFLFLSLLLFTCLVTRAQSRTITGVVTDEKGIPVASATILITGTNSGVFSDEEGRFSITIPEGKKRLEISAVGRVTRQITIGSESHLDIMLSQEQESMETIVVTAYGRQTRRSVTGAVSSINAQDIEKRALTSVTGALEGAATGVMVNNSYGQPGSMPAIRIRGFSSVNGNNRPLYVVDGVIMATDVVGTEEIGSSIADLNPNDIENISVLKDAAAAALFGNKASNGVVLITTKRASSGKPVFNAIVNQGMYTRGLKDYKTMTPDQYMETMWLGYRNNLLSTSNVYNTVEKANAKATQSVITDNIRYNIYNKPSDQLFDNNGKLVSGASILPGYAGDLDWYAPILQKGHRQDYNVNGGARNEKSSVYFSTGYLDEKGFFKRSRFQRFTGRLNADITPVKWFKTGVMLNGTSQNNNNYTDDDGAFNNPIENARTIAPVFPVHLHDATTGDYILDANGNKQYDDGSLYNRGQYPARHAIWENELNSRKTHISTMQGQAFANIRFLEDFSFTITGDLTSKNTELRRYENPVVGDGSGNLGRVGRNMYRYKTYTFQQQLNWSRFFGKHSFDVLAGHENYNFFYSNLYGNKGIQTFPGLENLDNFTSILDLGEYESVVRTESYLGRVRYNFDQKYFIEGSLRRDGSSRFNPQHRWGNFGGISAAWTVSKEAFLSGNRIINDLKLRAGYGSVGNDGSAAYYAWQSLYVMNQNANLGALYLSQVGATNLIWEKVGTWGAAVEGRLFDKLNFSAEYFDKRSIDLIFPFNLPLSAGATTSLVAEATVLKNLGTLSNKGWELAADYDIISGKEFRLNFGANATFLKNKIIRLPEENRKDGIISGSKKLFEGHSIYDFWLYQFAGVDQMNGVSLYIADDVVYNGGDPDKPGTAIPASSLVTINGKNYVNNTTYAKRDWSGTSIPKVFGGITLKADWKSLTFSALFTYSLGGKMLDYTYQDLMAMSGPAHNLHVDLLRAWNGAPAGMTETSPNRIDPKGVPVVDYSKSDQSNAVSSRFLQDASYGVIKNISLGYRLPAAVLERVSLRSLSINLTAENLATFTKLQGMDPQQSFNGLHYSYFMTPRVFSLGINLGL